MNKTLSSRRNESSSKSVKTLTLSHKFMGEAVTNASATPSTAPGSDEESSEHFKQAGSKVSPFSASIREDSRRSRGSPRTASTDTAHAVISPLLNKTLSSRRNEFPSKNVKTLTLSHKWLGEAVTHASATPSTAPGSGEESSEHFLSPYSASIREDSRRSRGSPRTASTDTAHAIISPLFPRSLSYNFQDTEAERRRGGPERLDTFTHEQSIEALRRCLSDVVVEDQGAGGLLNASFDDAADSDGPPSDDDLCFGRARLLNNVGESFRPMLGPFRSNKDGGPNVPFRSKQEDGPDACLEQVPTAGEDHGSENVLSPVFSDQQQVDEIFDVETPINIDGSPSVQIIDTDEHGRNYRQNQNVFSYFKSRATNLSRRHKMIAWVSLVALAASSSVSLVVFFSVRGLHRTAVGSLLSSTSTPSLSPASYRPVPSQQPLPVPLENQTVGPSSRPSPRLSPVSLANQTVGPSSRPSPRLSPVPLANQTVGPSSQPSQQLPPVSSANQTVGPSSRPSPRLSPVPLANQTVGPSSLPTGPPIADRSNLAFTNKTINEKLPPPLSIFKNSQITQDNIAEILNMLPRYPDQITRTFGNISDWNVSSLTDLTELFKNRRGPTDPLDTWDVSRVVKMQSLFQRSDYDGALSAWDVASSTSLERAFEGNERFDRSLNAWDVSRVAYFSRMFHRAERFDGAVGGWNTSSGLKMFGMFSWAIRFNQEIERWDVSRVFSMASMFEWATQFDKKLNRWDISRCKNLSRMFLRASSFNQDLSKWSPAPDRVLTVESMFEEAFKFNQTLCWNLTKDVITDQMFSSSLGAMSQSGCPNS